MTNPLVRILGIVTMLTVNGCGGTTPESPSTNTAEGLWSGMIGTNRTLTAAVLDDGTYYFFYFFPPFPVNSIQVAGVVQGTGISNNGSFSSTNAKDFGVGVSPLDATLSASFGSRQFLNGSVSYVGGATAGFTSSYNTAYDAQPTIASFAGVYQGQAGSSGGSQLATITVLADGTFTGTEQSGCTFTGTATLRARGNVLDQIVTFGQAPCFFAGSTFQGIVFLDIPNGRLYSAAPNGARTDAAIFFGKKII